jgi:hypothetical protein
MKRITGFIFLLLCITHAMALRQPKELKMQIDSILSYYERIYPGTGKLRVVQVLINSSDKQLNIYCNEALSYIPYRPEIVAKLYLVIDSTTRSQNGGYKLQIFAGNKEISTLISNIYRLDKLVDASRMPVKNYQGAPLTTSLSKPYSINKGLQNRHLAIWHSHGLYFNTRADRWEWQRGRLFQTVEDKYTMSYVLPYLLPMLENAGANVLLPRERDIQTHEVIVDNNGSTAQSIYREKGTAIESGGNSGFGFTKKQLTDTENPFALGTYRKTSARSLVSASFEWIPDIPEDGWYAVSIAYKTISNSSSAAHYSVFHTGGQTDFSVNQQMGGSTWIYLGNFLFKKGIHAESGKVTLTSSPKSNKVITADAVRFGGGMGNIARPDISFEIPKTPKTVTPEVIVDTTKIPSSSTFNDSVPTTENIVANEKSPLDTAFARSGIPVTSYKSARISGYPRYLEGARYWLQWAGMPSEVYHKRKDEGPNDYNEDIWARPYWVNYLNSGSLYAGKDTIINGLKIPIDLSLAIHSDAGTYAGDSIVGTLAICTTFLNNGLFSTGQSRQTSHDLTDIIQTQIVNDIRRSGTHNWTRRGIWDKSYAESREADVPSALIELLSHQNFADMKYGLDPRFRFMVSRSIYKAILKYIAYQHHQPFVVEPLPVSHLASEFVDDTHINLTWQSESDSLESTAIPYKYVVYTRIDGEGFDNGQIADGNSLTLAVEKGKIYSFKVTAINDGGESMPSEILSVCRSWNKAPIAMIVNGFDRISAPSWFDSSTVGGFTDNGVPDRTDISYTGKQNNFNRSGAYRGNDSPGFGGSDANFETTVIAGNSFDYPYIHGQALKAAGYSFVSCSRAAVEANPDFLQGYKVVDLIFGKEKQVSFGVNDKQLSFRTFTEKLNIALKNYCNKGGNLFVSGSFVGSDMWVNGKVDSTAINFITHTLKYKWHSSNASATGEVKGTDVPYPVFGGKWNFCTQLNSLQYAVEAADGIDPDENESKSFTIAYYPENNISAAVAYKGSYRTVVCGFPFEALSSETQRIIWMKKIIYFFEK